MKVLLMYFYSNLVENLSYKVNTFFSLINKVVMLFIFVSIWNAIYNGSSRIASDIYSYSELISYLVVSTFLSIIIENDVINSFNEKVRDGSIVFDLIRPLSLKSLLIVKNFSRSLLKVLFEFTPILIISILVFEVDFPIRLSYVPLFLVCAIGSWLIFFQFTYILGLFSFWVIEVWQFQRLLNDVIKVFSGAVIPLLFFPDKMQSILGMLPFKYIYYFPISVLLGKTERNEIISGLITMSIWVLLLIIIEITLWKKMIKKINVQGG
jgi:ABC-2 type transport system permease protein